MTPDKIYISQQSDVFGYYNAQKNPPYEEEYIRKDVLLEWVKEKEQNAITNLVKLTYKIVIDKIESL